MSLKKYADEYTQGKLYRIESASGFRNAPAWNTKLFPRNYQFTFEDEKFSLSDYKVYLKDEETVLLLSTPEHYTGSELVKILFEEEIYFMYWHNLRLIPLNV